jgi:hypothetical protein
MRRSLVPALCFLSASVVAQLSKADTVVYDNTTTSSGYVGVAYETLANQVFEMGDEVNLDGSARIGKQLDVSMYAFDDFFAYSRVVSLYDNTGIDGAPNNLLWTTDLGSSQYPAGLMTLSVALPDVLLPDTVTWTVEFSTDPRPSGPVYGFLFFDPPTVGSSGDWVWCNMYGFQSVSFDGQVSNFGARITAAVPEPSTLALLSIGAVSLMAYGWRCRCS